jgi:uncharacterized protein involved in cysteine biosynthesis
VRGKKNNRNYRYYQVKYFVMSDSTPSPAKRVNLPIPNPVTQAKHRREIRRQVIVPFVFCLVVIIGIIVWFVLTGVGTVERWAQVSSLLLMSFGMVLGLIVFALLVATVYVITQILRILPPYTRLAQDAIEKIDSQVKSGADISVKPVIEVQRFLAIIDALFRRRKVE